ncbi:MAG: 6-phosphogluconolactonase [Prolixibacteraceae bacterium]|nr:6-phosphogluconolactonase [Prolixibacteraceae bacterium]MBN2772765.1 6-phosphogluconolactonase [Prolixibacteraceae bacterium]
MNPSVEVKIFKTPKKVVKALAKELVNITHKSDQETFNIALSGGKTPKLLFETLAKKYFDLIPWDKIHFWWGDERCVPPDNIESNFNLANLYLFSGLLVPESNIHRIRGEEDPKKEALRYGKEIDDHLNMRGDWPVFDLIILGLGNDGHTASIFPYHMELIDYQKNCAVTKHPLTNRPRITITGNVLNNSNRVFFLVTGKNKALRIAEIMNDDDAAKLLPAYYIQPENGELVWYIDEDAASLIT